MVAAARVVEAVTAAALVGSESSAAPPSLASVVLESGLSMVRTATISTLAVPLLLVLGRCCCCCRLRGSSFSRSVGLSSLLLFLPGPFTAAAATCSPPCVSAVGW